MGLSSDLIFAAAFAYAALLFAVAAYADWSAGRGRLRWLNSPLVYTLSISVYCTSWTFYGAVGTAARDGLQFLTIYLGPTIVFIGWWAFMRRMVRIGRAQRTTSIADFLSSRFGKSPALAATITLIAVIVITPYIALQLRAISASFQVLAQSGVGLGPDGDEVAVAALDAAELTGTALWVAVGLALFTILFGTRNLDADERHQGVVAAIALEAIVKLTALLAVGLLAVYGAANGWADVAERASKSIPAGAAAFDARWAAITFLSAAAIICLPRQFQVTVVECVDERHGATASWAFPLYLFLVCLFVTPIAAVGLDVLPKGSDPDLFVLTLPLDQGWNAAALLAFLGGFSSATSMVIVSCIALSTMVSNHLAMPLALRIYRAAAVSGDFQRFLLTTRRISICAILGLGFLYLVWSRGSEALAAIGLISFAGVAQFLPLLMAAVFWRRATAAGAIAGLLAGFAVWLVLLFAPSLANLAFSDTARGVAVAAGDDPLLATLFWSLAANVFFLVLFSLIWEATPFERLQAAAFLSAGAETSVERPLLERTAATSDLYVLAQRILGGDAAHRLFEEYRRRQGLSGGMPTMDAALLEDLERRLAGGVGAASAHAMVSEIATGATISLEGMMKLADENARLLHYSARLEEQSAALRETALQLRAANERLKELDAQKDDFLAQISHELRTPMTSMRAFSELLLRPAGLPMEKLERFARIIHEESLRLTRLLDQILDFGRIERGEFALQLTALDPEPVVDRALAAVSPLADAAGVSVCRRAVYREEALVAADADRIQQVLMNVLSNSVKFNTGAAPQIWIVTRLVPAGGGMRFEIEISDNGPGVPPADSERIFRKFERGAPEAVRAKQGVGLGLAISREIMALHGGDIRLIAPTRNGASFLISLPALSEPEIRARKAAASAESGVSGA